MRPAAHSLSFASPKESKQRKGDPKSATPSLALRGKPGAWRLRGVPQNSLRAGALRSNNCGKSNNDACALRRACHPASTPPQAQPQGVEQPDTGHRCARPGAARREAPAPIEAERSDGPCRPPSLLAVPRSAVHGVGMGALAPMLRELIRRGCLNEARQRAVSSTAHPMREHRRLPVAKRRDTDSRVAFSLLTFFWRSKRK